MGSVNLCVPCARTMLMPQVIENTFHTVRDFYNNLNGWAKILVLSLVCAVIIAIIVAVIVKLLKHRNKDNPYDDLTELGNKNYLNSSYNRLSELFRRHYCMAYISYDLEVAKQKMTLEQFKELEITSAKLIAQSAGNYDYPARLGNGEFALCFRYSELLKAKRFVNSLIEMLNKNENGLLDATPVPFRAGMYFLTEEAEPLKIVIDNAKIGYNYAYLNNVNMYVCTKEVLLNEASRHRLRDKLSNAIDKEQFDMFLQFVYNTKSKKFDSAEVLSRWNDPVEGFLMPAYYINDMLNTGVIDKFDYYMLEKTCRVLQKWKNSEFSDLSLSCNITRITISSSEFLNHLHSIIKKYDFDHSKLILEITEDALFDSHSEANKNVSQCKEEGLRIAIDDFGAGNSSINDLCDYPIDFIKIDRHLITKTTTQRGSALISGLIELSHRLGLQVVCEGVETEKQKEIITKNGSDYIQGYFYSYVFPLEEAKRYYLESLEK